MQKHIYIAVLILLPFSGFSQNWAWINELSRKNEEAKKEPAKKEEPKERLVTYEIIGDDTIPVIYLPDMVIMDSDYKNKYDKHLYYIKRMYPYARLIAQISHDYDSTLEDIGKRRQRKKFVNQQKEIAMAQFENAVKHMSVREGKYLVKLIHRECGETAYEVIEKYLGGAKTFLWQTASRIGGADLKLKYDPEGEDKIMEDVMKKVDGGEIKIRKLKLDPNAVEKQKAAEVLAKEKKKEAKQKNKEQKKSG